jgi:putative SOS response-associated peptidase YedK
MCNRYQQAAIQEAKDALNAIIETPFNVGHDIIHPQSPGLVVKQANGRRVLANMTWGFPLILAEARERAAAKGTAVMGQRASVHERRKSASGSAKRRRTLRRVYVVSVRR